MYRARKTNSGSKLKRFTYGLFATLLAVVLVTLDAGTGINKAEAVSEQWGYSTLRSPLAANFNMKWKDWGWGDGNLPYKTLGDASNPLLLKSVNKGAHIESISQPDSQGNFKVEIAYNKGGVDWPTDPSVKSVTSRPFFGFFISKGFDLVGGVKYCRAADKNGTSYPDCHTVSSLKAGKTDWPAGWVSELHYSQLEGYPFDDAASRGVMELADYRPKAREDGIQTGLANKSFAIKYEGWNEDPKQGYPVKMYITVKPNGYAKGNMHRQFIGAVYKSWDRGFNWRRFHMKLVDDTQWNYEDRYVRVKRDDAKTSSCFAGSVNAVNSIFTTSDGQYHDQRVDSKDGALTYNYVAYHGETGPVVTQNNNRFYLNGRGNQVKDNNGIDNIPYLKNGENKYSLQIGFQLHYTYSRVAVNGREPNTDDVNINYWYTDVLDKAGSTGRIQTAVNDWKTTKYDAGKQTLEEKEEAYTKAKAIQQTGNTTINAAKTTTQCAVLDTEILTRDKLAKVTISDAYKTAARAKVDGLSDLNQAQKTAFKDAITNDALQKADVDAKVKDAEALNEAIKQLKVEIAKQPTVQKEERYIYDTQQKQTAYNNAVKAGSDLLAKNVNTSKTEIDTAKQKIITAEQALNGRRADILDGDPNGRPPSGYWRITLNSGDGSFPDGSKTKVVDVRTEVPWNHAELVTKLESITNSLQSPNAQKAFVGWSPKIPNDSSLVSALPYTQRTFTARFDDILKENNGQTPVDANYYYRLTFNVGKGTYSNTTAKSIYLDVHKTVKWNSTELWAKVNEYKGLVVAPADTIYMGWTPPVPRGNALITDKDPKVFDAIYEDKVTDGNGKAPANYKMLTFKSSDKGSFGSGVTTKYVNVHTGVNWDDPAVTAKINEIQAALTPNVASDIFTGWDQAIPTSGAVDTKTFTATFNGIVIDVTDGVTAPKGYYRITLQAGKGSFSGSNSTTRLLDVHPTAVAWNNPVLIEKLKEVTGMLQAPSGQGFTGWNPVIPSDDTLVSALPWQKRIFTASYGDLLKENDGSAQVDADYYNRLSFDAGTGSFANKTAKKIYLDVHKTVKWNDSSLQAKVAEYAGAIQAPEGKSYAGWNKTVPNSNATIAASDPKDFQATYRDKVMDSDGAPVLGYNLLTFKSSDKGNFGSNVTVKYLNVLNGVTWNDPAVTAKIAEIEAALKPNSDSDIFTGWDQAIPNTGAVAIKTFTATFNGKVIDGSGFNPPANYVRLTFKSSDDGRFGSNNSDNTVLVDVHNSLTWDAKELKTRIAQIEASLQSRTDAKVYSAWNKAIPQQGRVQADTFTAQFVNKVIDGTGAQAPSGYVRLIFNSSSDGKFSGTTPSTQKLVDVQQKVAWNDSVLTAKIKEITASLKANSDAKAFVNWNPTVPTQGTVVAQSFDAVFKDKVTTGNGSKVSGYHLLTFNATSQGSFPSNAATKYLNVLDGVTWNDAVLKAEIAKLTQAVTPKENTKAFVAWSPVPKTDATKVADSSFDATYTDKVVEGSGTSAKAGYKRLSFNAGSDGEYKSGDKSVRHLDVYETVLWNDSVLQDKIAALPAQLNSKSSAKTYTGWTPAVPNNNALVKDSPTASFTAVFSVKVKPGTGNPAQGYLSLNFKAGAGKFRESTGDVDDKYLDVLPGTAWDDPEITKAVSELEALLVPVDSAQAFVGWDQEKLPTTGKVNANGAKVFTAQWDAKVKVVEANTPENPLYQRISFNSGTGKFLVNGKANTDIYLDVHKATTWGDPALKAKITEIEGMIQAPAAKSYVGWNQAFPADTEKVGDANAKQRAYTAQYSSKVEIGDGTPKDGYHLVTFDASSDGEFRENPADAAAPAGVQKKYLNILKGTSWDDSEVTTAITQIASTLQAKTAEKIFKSWDQAIPERGQVTEQTFTAQFVDKVVTGSGSKAPAGYVRLTFNSSNDGKYTDQSTSKALDVYKDVVWNDPVLAVKIADLGSELKPVLSTKKFTNWNPLVPSEGLVKASTFTAVFKDKVKPGTGQPAAGYLSLHFSAGNGKFKSGSVEAADKYLDVLEGVTWDDTRLKVAIANLPATLAPNSASESFQKWDPVVPEDAQAVTARTFTAQYVAKVLDGSGDSAPEGYTRLTFNSSGDATFKAPGNEQVRYLDVYQSVKWNDATLTAKITQLRDLLQVKDDSKIFINWNPAVPATTALVKNAATKEFTAQYQNKVIVSEDGSGAPADYQKLTFQAGLGQYGDNAQAKVKYLLVHPSLSWDNQLLTEKVAAFESELKAPVASQSFTKWTPSVPKSGAVKDSKDKAFTANYDERIKVVTGTETTPGGYVRMSFDANGGRFLAPANAKVPGEHKIDVKVGTDWDEVKAHMATRQPVKANMHFTSWTPDLAAQSGNVADQSYNFTANYAANIQEVPDGNVPAKPGFLRLEFQANGGEFADGTDLYQIDVKIGTAWNEVITHMEKHKPSKTGTFLSGWNPRLSAQGANVTEQSNRTFVAQYSQNIKEVPDPSVNPEAGYVRLNFEANGGKYEGNKDRYQIDVKGGTDWDEVNAYMEHHVPSKSGAHFVVYRPDLAKKTGTVDAAMPEADKTFTAQYQDNILTSDPQDSNYALVEFKAEADDASVIRGEIAPGQTAKYWVYLQAQPVITLADITHPSLNVKAGYVFEVWDKAGTFEITAPTVVMAQYYFAPAAQDLVVDKGTALSPEMFVKNHPGAGTDTDLPAGTGFSFVANRAGDPIQPPQLPPSSDKTIWNPEPVYVKVSYANGTSLVVEAKLKVRSDAEKYENDLGNTTASGTLVMRKNENPNSAAVLARVTLEPASNLVKGYKSLNTTGKDFTKPTPAGQPIETTGVVEFKDGSTYTVPVVRVTVEDLDASVVPVIKTKHHDDDLWTDDRGFDVQIPKITVNGAEQVPSGDLVVKVGDQVVPKSAVSKRDDGGYRVELPAEIKLSTTTPVRVEFTEPNKNPAASEKTPIQSQRHLYEPLTQEVVVDKDDLPDASDLIANKDSDQVTDKVTKLPSGTSFEYVDASGKVTVPDVSTAGKKPVKVKVTYPDGSSEVVDGTITVRTDAEKYQNDNTDKNGFNAKGTGEVVKGTPFTKDKVQSFTPELPQGAGLESVVASKINVNELTTTVPQKTTGKVKFSDGSTIDDFPIEVTVVAGQAGEYEPLLKTITVDKGAVVTPEDLIINKFTDPAPADPNAKKLPEKTQFIFVNEQGQETTVDTSSTGSKAVQIKVTYPDGSIEFANGNVMVRSDAEKYENDLGNDGASGALVMKKNEDPNSAAVLKRVELTPAAPTLKGFKSIATAGHDFTKPTPADQPIVTTGVVEFKDGSTYTVPVVRVSVEDLPNSVIPEITTTHGNNDLWTDDREFTVSIPKITVDGAEVTPDGKLVVTVGGQKLPDSAVTKQKDGSYLVQLPAGVELATDKKVQVEFTEPNKNPATSEKTPIQSQRHYYEPVTQEVVVGKGNLPAASDLIANKDSDAVTESMTKLPAGSSFEYVDASGKVTVPDVSTAGKKSVKVKVTYPDGSSEVVEGTIKVRSDAEKYLNDAKEDGVTPRGDLTVVKGQEPKLEEVQIDPALPAGAKLTAFNEQIDVHTLTPVDEPQKITGTVTFADGSTINDLPINVYIVEGQAGEYEPVAKELEIEVGQPVNAPDFIVNKFTDLDPSDPAVKKLPENTQYVFVDENGETSQGPDTAAPGKHRVIIKVVYPDGSFDLVKTSLVVKKTEVPEPPRPVEPVKPAPPQPQPVTPVTPAPAPAAPQAAPVQPQRPVVMPLLPSQQVEQVAPPVIDPVTKGDKEITGSGVPGSTVVLTLPGGGEVSVVVEQNGKFKVKLSRAIDSGTIKAKAKLNGYADSEEVTVKVKEPAAAKSAPAPAPVAAESGSWSLFNLLAFVAILGLALLAAVKRREEEYADRMGLMWGLIAGGFILALLSGLLFFLTEELIGGSMKLFNGYTVFHLLFLLVEIAWAALLVGKGKNQALGAE